MNLPAMLQAARQMGGEYEFVLPVASTLEPAWVRNLVEDSNLPLRLTGDARASLFHARAAVVASGTATVEAALLGVPFVMVYRVAPLTWALGKHLVRVPHFGMVNLIAGREVVPELVQHKFTPEQVAGELRTLLENGDRRQEMLRALDSVRQALHAGRQRDSAAQCAAAAILEELAASLTAAGAAHP